MMIVLKLILCILLVGIVYEAYWLIRHRREVTAFARDNELIPRRTAAANNVVIGAVVIGATLVSLIIYALIAA